MEYVKLPYLSCFFGLVDGAPDVLEIISLLLWKKNTCNISTKTLCPSYYNILIKLNASSPLHKLIGRAVSWKKKWKMRSGIHFFQLTQVYGKFLYRFQKIGTHNKKCWFLSLRSLVHSGLTSDGVSRDCQALLWLKVTSLKWVTRSASDL